MAAWASAKGTRAHEEFFIVEKPSRYNDTPESLWFATQRLRYLKRHQGELCLTIGDQPIFPSQTLELPGAHPNENAKGAEGYYRQSFTGSSA
jgi:hypothetical protein